MIDKALKVDRGRTTTIPFKFAYDLSGSTITSEIRVEQDASSLLIATWQVLFKTDGKDGRIILHLDNSISSVITATSGYTDFKRVVGGEPVSMLDRPIPVIFRGVVTA